LDWAHADTIIRRQPVDVLVVDPQFDAAQAPRSDRIRAVRNRYRSLPIVVYSTLTANTLKPLVELGSDGIGQIVLFGLDDDPRHLKHLLELQPGIRLGEKLVSLLRARLELMPGSVAAAIERAIRNPAVFRGVGDLAAAAGVPRRSLYRHLARAGVVTPREVLAGARVLRAYAFLAVPGYTLDMAAHLLCFSDTDAMTRAMKHSVGVTPGRARKRLANDTFVRRLAEHIMSGAADITGQLRDDVREFAV
jgi:AraC-like DNA-binding protein